MTRREIRPALQQSRAGVSRRIATTARGGWRGDGAGRDYRDEIGNDPNENSAALCIPSDLDAGDEFKQHFG
jgi:hypothetical protein